MSENKPPGNPDAAPEQFLTITEASSILGVPQWTLMRSVKRGLFPGYYFGSKRMRVKISEILKIVETSR